MGDYPPGYKLLNSFFDQERMGGYKPDVYHPVSLGDRFKDDRYQIYHKLGWGGYSTVWLAKDTMLVFCSPWLQTQASFYVLGSFC